MNYVTRFLNLVLCSADYRIAPGFALFGFSLFGTSGNKSTNSNTTTTNNDFTTSDSNNTTNNTKNVQTSVANTSNINNDTRIQNTALQLTDAFNRFNTYNLAGSGNVNINGGSNADDAAKYIGLFGALQPNYGGMNSATPDLSKGLLDFSTLSKIAPDIIGKSGEVAKIVQDGFANNTRIAGDISRDVSKEPGGITSNPLIWIVGAVAAVILAVVLTRRK